MEFIKPNDRGRMYAALVKSYAEGWSWNEAAAYWSGVWPESVESDNLARLIHGSPEPWEQIQQIFNVRGNAEFWFSEKRNDLAYLLDFEDADIRGADSPIVKLFDYFLSKNRQFLFEGLAKKQWTGEESLYYLSCCPKDFVSKTKRVIQLSPNETLDESLDEFYTDYLKIKELLCMVMKDGVSKNYYAEFYGHKAINKFNKSEDGMNLPHPVSCFKAFSRDKLEPQAFSPFIFRMANVIDAVTAKSDSKGLSTVEERPQSHSEQQNEASIENIEVVDGVTVKQLRALLDEKNEGTTFCPRLLAAIRVELELNAMREQVKGANTFTMMHGKSEGKCRKELIEQHCRALKIFNCNDSDAIKQSGRRTVTPQDTKPIERVLMHEREAKIGRR